MTPRNGSDGPIVRDFKFLMLLAVVLIAMVGLASAASMKVRAIASGEKGEVKGIISARDGDIVRVLEGDGATVMVVLGDATKIQLKKGALKLRKESLDATALLPGLKVEAKGIGNSEGQLLAENISFNPDDLKIAKAMQTRVAPLEAKQAQTEGDVKTAQLSADKAQASAEKAQASADIANAGVDSIHQRLSSLDDYDTKAFVTVYFDVNKFGLSPEAKKDLDGLVEQSRSLKGYMIEVAGYADPTGNAEKNQVLSEKRAEAVVQYLQQIGKVPLRRILAPVGLGETEEATAKSAQGRQQSRRVEVRLIVNKGLTA